MSEEEEVYDPTVEKDIDLEKQKPKKWKPSKKELKKLKYDDRLFPQAEDTYPSKVRRVAVNTKQKSYYEEVVLEVDEEKAKKYWEDLDTLFFRSLNREEFEYMRKKITVANPVIFTLEREFANNQRLPSFLESVIYARNPELFQNFYSIKALFKPEEGEGVMAFMHPQTSSRMEEEGDETEGNKVNLQLRGLTTVTNTDLLLSYLSQDQDQLSKQIRLWDSLRSPLLLSNSHLWSLLLSRYLSMPDKKFGIQQKQIDRIFQTLYWSTILKLFIQGHRDKTSGIFEYYNISGEEDDTLERALKSKGSNKKFQTDCKICFCSSNYESNKVVYCDHCNTSFHQICYGLRNLPKSEKYYCEVCSQFRLAEERIKPECKLCEKSAFPMKKMDGYFYHVTCLVLNNLVEFRELELRLRKGVTFRNILKLVIDSEVRQNYCEFCDSAKGIQFHCQNPGCDRTFHPICAYLYGCSFDLKRTPNTNDLEVKITCNNHHPFRNTCQQVYYRRYVCDFKRTSQKQFLEFQEEFKRELSASSLKRKRPLVCANGVFVVTQLMRSMHKRIKNKTMNIKTETSKLFKRG